MLILKNSEFTAKNDGVTVGVPVQVSDIHSVKLGSGKSRQAIDFVGIFRGSEIIIDGYGEVFGQQILTVNVFRPNQKKPLVLNEVALKRMGYQILAYSPCYIVLRSVDADFFATCAKDSPSPVPAVPALPAQS